MRTLLLAIAAALALVAPAAVGNEQRPYAGQQARAIKALSDEETAALRNGEGMGFAKVAELNGYPGPRHVLDLAAELGLSEPQLRQVRTVWERMNAAARALGAELIEREAGLDQLFAAGGTTQDRVEAETAAIAAVQARLRATHLLAHLDTRALLSGEQVAQYNRLRGYTSSPGPHGGHRH